MQEKKKEDTVDYECYGLSAEPFFTLPPTGSDTGAWLLLQRQEAGAKPAKFWWQMAKLRALPWGSSQLASLHLLSGSDKSYYFMYIKI